MRNRKATGPTCQAVTYVIHTLHSSGKEELDCTLKTKSQIPLLDMHSLHLIEIDHK